MYSRFVCNRSQIGAHSGCVRTPVALWIQSNLPRQQSGNTRTCTLTNDLVACLGRLLWNWNKQPTQ